MPPTAHSAAGFHGSDEMANVMASSPLAGTQQWQYTFEKFFQPAVGQLITQLNRTSIAGMLDPAFLANLTIDFPGYRPDPAHDPNVQVDPISRQAIDVTVGGPYANYNWELFYHIPVAVAVYLSKNQRFAEAQRWFHLVFDPTSTEKVAAGKAGIVQLFDNGGRLGMNVYGSDGADGYKTTFAWADMGQASTAIGWLTADLNGDGKTEIVQLFDNGGRLGMNVYGSDGAGGYTATFTSTNMGQGAGAVSWLTADLSGDGKADIIQLWDNGGRLGMIVYGSDGAGGYPATFATGDMGQASAAIGWLTADLNGDGKAEIVQLVNNGGRLGMNVYGSDGAGGYTATFTSTNMGQGAGAVSWLTADLSGDGKADIIQLWDNGGRLGMIVYGSDGAGGYPATFATGDMGQASAAISWLTADLNGDGKAEIVQLVNNGGRLGMNVYGSDGAGGYTATFTSTNMGQGAGAVSWLTADLSGDGKADIIQLWDNGGRLGMIVYGSDGAGGYPATFATGDMGQASAAVGWLTADLNGDGKAATKRYWKSYALRENIDTHSIVALLTLLSTPDPELAGDAGKAEAEKPDPGRLSGQPQQPVQPPYGGPLPADRLPVLRGHEVPRQPHRLG